MPELCRYPSLLAVVLYSSLLAALSKYYPPQSHGLECFEPIHLFPEAYNICPIYVLPLVATEVVAVDVRFVLRHSSKHLISH